MAKFLLVTIIVTQIAAKTSFKASESSKDFIDAFGTCLKINSELAFIPNRLSSEALQRAVVLQYPNKKL